MMQLSEIIIAERPRKDMGDIAALAKSIEQCGLLHPVVVARDGTLIAGHRRIEAVRTLGYTHVPVTVVDVAEMAYAKRNGEHKTFTRTESVAVGILIEREHALKVAALVREQRVYAGKLSHGINVVKEYTRAGKSVDVVATALGISNTTYTRARAVCIEAEKNPELLGDLPAQMDATGNVNGTYKELRRRMLDPYRAPVAVAAKTGRSAKPKREPRHAVFKHKRYLIPNRAVERAIPMLDGALDVLEQLKTEELDATRTEQWSADFKKFARRLARIASRIGEAR